LRRREINAISSIIIYIVIIYLKELLRFTPESTVSTFTYDTSQLARIGGSVLFILGVFLLYYYFRNKALLSEVSTVHPYSARELRLMCSHDFQANVKAEGTVTCDSPVIAPASRTPCCWCKTKIDQKVERTGRYGEPETYWEPFHDEVRSAIFKLTDETGYVLVDPKQAEIDTEKPQFILAEALPETYTNADLQLDSQEMIAFAFEMGIPANYDYRITEEIFLSQGYAYVLGQATCAQEGTNPDVLIHYPSKGYVEPGKKVFVISRKEEEEIVAEEGITLKICFWFSMAAFLVAAYCLVVAR